MSYFDTPITADAAQAAGGFDPIPNGTYTLNCLKCEEKDSSKGDPMLSMTWEVDGSTPDYGRRKLFAIIMLKHANPKVEQMGKAQLHALLLMAGMSSISSADDLVGRTIVAQVKVSQRKDTGEMRNEIVFAKPKAVGVVAAPAAKNTTSWD